MCQSLVCALNLVCCDIYFLREIIQSTNAADNNLIVTICMNANWGRQLAAIMNYIRGAFYESE